jgi:hypothetical protein
VESSTKDLYNSFIISYIVCFAQSEYNPPDNVAFLSLIVISLENKKCKEKEELFMPEHACPKNVCDLNLNSLIQQCLKTGQDRNLSENSIKELKRYLMEFGKYCKQKISAF